MAQYPPPLPPQAAAPYPPAQFGFTPPAPTLVAQSLAPQAPAPQAPMVVVLQQPQPQGQVQVQTVATPSPAPPITAAPVVAEGIKALADLSYIFVKQLEDKQDGTKKVDKENEYLFSNFQNTLLFKGSEESDSCARFLHGMRRSFRMIVTNVLNHPVMEFRRPLACQSCFFGCCLQRMEVYAPAGNLIGSIGQEWSMFRAQYVVYSASGEGVLKINGPCYVAASCFNDSNFEHFDLRTGAKSGRFAKKWKGGEIECSTDQDNFGVSFPKEMDINLKALLMGACVLIDYNFFEVSANKCGCCCC